MLSSVIKNFLHIILPTSCRTCGKNLIREDQPYFCNLCWAGIQPIPPPVCPRCGEPFASDAALEHSPGHLCGECRDRLPAFDSARAAGYYQGVLVEAIRLFKYQAKTKLSRHLSARMCEAVRKAYNAPAGLEKSFDAVLAVPLHPVRLRQREFNQSLLLAHGMSRGLEIPLLFDALERSLWTRPQVELDGEERRKNVRKAFRVKYSKQIEGLRLLLVDDVYTTGATVNECAKVLKKSGAKEVHVMTLARMGGA